MTRLKDTGKVPGKALSKSHLMDISAENENESRSTRDHHSILVSPQNHTVNILKSLGFSVEKSRFSVKSSTPLRANISIAERFEGTGKVPGEF